ncbi:hypothetical protein J4401_06135 [Candidatus Woesearchaeota archaeon]|nr:hypothetical protein [Candidatus Woesearchaeota archaeon]
MARIKLVVDGFQCERCSHKWIPRVKRYPVICPSCKSPYWDKPRRNKRKNVQKE